jgi:hypothetical protein
VRTSHFLSHRRQKSCSRHRSYMMQFDERISLPLGLKNPVIQKHFGRPSGEKDFRMNREIPGVSHHGLTNCCIACIDPAIQRTRIQECCFPTSIESNQRNDRCSVLQDNAAPNRWVRGHRRSNRVFDEATRSKASPISQVASRCANSPHSR